MGEKVDFEENIFYNCKNARNFNASMQIPILIDAKTVELTNKENMWLFLERYVTSTMPYAQKWVKKQNIIIRMCDYIFRGISEVIFMNNSITGFIILVTLFI